MSGMGGSSKDAVIRTLAAAFFAFLSFAPLATAAPAPTDGVVVMAMHPQPHCVRVRTKRARTPSYT
jgi:hypothetical protein